MHISSVYIPVVVFVVVVLLLDVSQVNATRQHSRCPENSGTEGSLPD